MNPKWKRPHGRRRKVVAAPRRNPRLLGTGGFTVRRKVTDLWLANSNTLGIPIQGGGSGASSLVIGTPVVNPIFGGVYSLPFSFTFTLDNLANYTDITAICDKYKITNVTIKAMYNCTAVQGSTVSAAFPSFMPLIKWTTDFDDGNATTVLECNQKMGLKSKSLGNGKVVKMSVKPRAALALYQPAATPYSVPSKSLYVNSAYPIVPHYGIKGYLENFCLQANTLATSCITFELEYTVHAKDLQ